VDLNYALKYKSAIMQQRLADRVAIITGGAKGIGRATVERFLAEGARVAIWDVDTEAGERTLAALSVGEEHCRFYSADTTKLAAISDLAARVNADFGQIDILINNAGIIRDASLKKMTPEQWQRVIDVNLSGVFNCTKAVAPYLKESSAGRIISAASVVAHNGNFGQTNYVAAKAGVIGMTKVWAREFRRKGVTVNAIAPGFINTEMVETVPEELLRLLKDKTPLGRMGEPREIAQAYAFLASDEAAFITGTVLNVDGGLVM